MQISKFAVQLSLCICMKSLNKIHICLTKAHQRRLCRVQAYSWKSAANHFYVGSRKAQVLHTRLRTNCSSLNLDLFLRNISDSPLCQCGSIENAQHYFFHCRCYQIQRTELLNIVSQYQIPSLSLLLYGNDSLSLDTNKIIFEKVHKYILDSKRF